MHSWMWALVQIREAIDQHWAERGCWPAARCDDARVARRLSRQPGSLGSTSGRQGPCGRTGSLLCRRWGEAPDGQPRQGERARVETAVVGSTGLTTDDQDGTPEPGRHHHRRAVHPHPSHAVVVRPW
jgi:hypothetical protein